MGTELEDLVLAQENQLRSDIRKSQAELAVYLGIVPHDIVIALHDDNDKAPDFANDKLTVPRGWVSLSGSQRTFRTAQAAAATLHYRVNEHVSKLASEAATNRDSAKQHFFWTRLVRTYVALTRTGHNHGIGVANYKVQELIKDLRMVDDGDIAATAKRYAARMYQRHGGNLLTTSFKLSRLSELHRWVPWQDGLVYVSARDWDAKVQS